MRFFARVFIFASLAFISLLWCCHLHWRQTPQSPGELTTENKEADSPLTFDSLLHIQQLRKKTRKSFCDKAAKITRLPVTQQEASRVLSSIMVNNKLQFLYCKIPGTGVENWEQLLEILEEKDITPPMPIPNNQQFGDHKTLSEYNLTSIEAMLKSYTKVIFIREPFHRLISAYIHRSVEDLTFKEFVQYVLYRGFRNASIEWKPLVTLCRPCLVQYDYTIMFGFLDREVQHLMFRIGLPENIRLPEFIDSKIQWAYYQLEDQMLSELTLLQRKQLCHFFRFDSAAFHFPRSLLRDTTCMSKSN